jgi:hypothetical protein
MVFVMFGDHDNDHKLFLFVDEQLKTQRLENEVKDPNESLRTQHNQAEEVIEQVSEEFA